MNKSKFYFETVILPQQLNQLQIKVKGLPTSYINIQIERTITNSDTTPPILNAVISTEYIFSNYPQTVTVQISANEDLKSLQINGVLANMLSPRNFSYLLQIDQPQTVNLNLLATDLANNVTTQTFSPIFNIDNIAPTISTNLSQNQLTNQSRFTINITDNSQTTTEIYINEILQLTSVDKSITANLSEGANNIRIRSFDIYNNQSIDTVILNITLDTQAPQITNNIKSEYFYKNLPFSQIYTLTSSESLSSLKINGQIQSVNQNLSLTSQVLFETTSPQTITIDATDLAGNQIQFAKTITLIKDDTAPEIILPQIPAIILTSSYLLNIQINDVGETQTVIKIDDLILSPVALKNFSVLLDFPIDQTKNIQITSTDGAGNQSQKIFSIRRDTSPLKVDFITPQSYGTYPSRTVQVRLRANKPLLSATLNTIPISLNADQISFGQNIEVVNEGQYTFSATVTDIFGNTAEKTITFEIKTRSMASWEYQECPAE